MNLPNALERASFYVVCGWTSVPRVWLDICELIATTLLLLLPQRVLPEQKEPIHNIQMLKKEDCAGQIEDLAHVVSADCLFDCLTKSSAKADALVKAVSSSVLSNLDMHPPFRSLLIHKGLFDTVAA